MNKVDVHEAKTILPKLLELVAKGHQVTITKHGVPVAILGPYKSEKNDAIEDIISQLNEFRENNALAGLTIQEMIEDGRR